MSADGGVRPPVGGTTEHPDVDPPFIDEDARAWWIDGTPLDVVADPTGRTPSIQLRSASPGRLTPTSARQLAAVLIAAADYCDGAE